MAKTEHLLVLFCFPVVVVHRQEVLLNRSTGRGASVGVCEGGGIKTKENLKFGET